LTRVTTQNFNIIDLVKFLEKKGTHEVTEPQMTSFGPFLVLFGIFCGIFHSKMSSIPLKIVLNVSN
jgi:hypothetical protein